MNPLAYILAVVSILVHTDADRQCVEGYFHKTEERFKDVYDKIEIQNEYGIRHSIDSLNFSIIRRWTDKGVPIIESVKNNLTNIERWKEYHANGKLKEFGYMPEGNHTKVGVWQYYTKKGRLDSTVDYDSKYGMPFCEFIKIAEMNQLYDETSTISFDLEKGKWSIIKWTSLENHSVGNGISVNAKTGTVVKETFHAEH